MAFDPNRRLSTRLAAARSGRDAVGAGARRGHARGRARRNAGRGADVRATPATLRRQAEVARAAGRRQLADNLERAAELAGVPDDQLLEIYTALRPGRSTAAELEAWAVRLEGWGAPRTAAFVREAAAAYVARGLARCLTAPRAFRLARREGAPARAARDAAARARARRRERAERPGARARGRERRRHAHGRAGGGRVRRDRPVPRCARPRPRGRGRGDGTARRGDRAHARRRRRSRGPRSCGSPAG